MAAPNDGATPPAGSTPPASTPPSREEFVQKKMIVGILGILVGSLGIHKFVLGFKKEGLIMLLVSVLTCGFGASIMGIIGLIEGIMYLTKTDDQFYQEYAINKKAWF